MGKQGWKEPPQPQFPVLQLLSHYMSNPARWCRRQWQVRDVGNKAWIPGPAYFEIATHAAQLGVPDLEGNGKRSKER